LIKKIVFEGIKEREREILYRLRKATRKFQELNQRLKISKFLLMEMKGFTKTKLDREHTLLNLR